jgi:pimeloyl-ACP methyl ester carboxylesterase
MTKNLDYLEDCLLKSNVKCYKSIKRFTLNLKHSTIHSLIHNSNKEKNLILIHGIGGSTMTFLHMIDYFVDHYNVYLIDIPGFGRSEVDEHFILSKTVPNMIDFFVECIYEYMKYMNIENTTIFAHSFGVMISVLLASKHKQMIDQLIMINPAGFLPFSGYFSFYIGMLYKQVFIFDIFKKFNNYVLNAIEYFTSLETAYLFRVYNHKSYIAHKIINSVIKKDKYIYNTFPLIKYINNLDCKVAIIHNQNDMIVSINDSILISKLFDVNLNIYDHWTNHSISHKSSAKTVYDFFVDSCEKSKIPKKYLNTYKLSDQYLSCYNCSFDVIKSKQTYENLYKDLLFNCNE